MAKITDPGVAALFDAVNFATLTTVNEDDSLTSSILWINVEDGKVAINGAAGRRWTENVQRDGRVAIVVADGSNPYDYVEIRGKAVQSDEDPDAHIDRLAQKYVNQDTYPFRQPGEVRLKFYVEPTLIRHQQQ